MPFAEIVVNSNASRATTGYHYYVPSHIELQVGHLVLVPFGPRQMQGVVVSLLENSDVEGIKDVIALIDQQPVLTEPQVQLARWIAEYYHCPLLEAVRLMLPSGIQQRSIATIEAKMDAPIPPDLTDKQARLLSFLRQHGRIRIDKAKTSLSLPSFSSVVAQLTRQGLLIRSWELVKPRAQPRLERVVRLAADPQDLAQSLAHFDRAPRQKQLLEYLLEKASTDAREGAGMPPGVSSDAIRTELGCTMQVLKALERKGIIRIEQRKTWRDPLASHAFVPGAQVQLTDHQTAIWNEIAKSLRARQSKTYLLHGITGSGKTEIYVRCLHEVLQLGQRAIVLVPEIALTPQTVHRFASHFPGRLAVWHSRLAEGERYDQWRRVRDGALDIVIGSRSAVFAPVPNLGIIIVDEEHEWSYKNEQRPRYHARDVAIKLAELTGATVLLGSATPDVVTYHRAKMGQYVLLELPERVEAGDGRSLPHVRGESIELSAAGEETAPAERMSVMPGANEDAFAHQKRASQSSLSAQERSKQPALAFLPPVHIVDLRQELKAGNRGIFSRALVEAITLALAMREQVILFLNRRGAATFVICRDCGHVLRCKRCDIPLVYHSAEDDLVCHQCNYRTFTPNGCPNCWSSRIRFFGVGTQKVEEEARALFPRARVLRWDSDAASGRGAHEQILQRFRNHEADILIGTQMIAKGLDLPLVTLVGVISADTILHLPDFRAGERTFQLLMQVAGRAGRGPLGGRVIIQTYSPEHYAIQAASRHDYFRFYQQEVEFRHKYGYPPFSKLIKLVYAHTNERKCQQEADRFAEQLRETVDRLGLPGVEVVGPAPAYIRRLRGRFRWQIIIRGSKLNELLQGKPIRPGWAVDVDPMTTL